MSLLDVARTRYTTKHYDPAKRVSDADFEEVLAKEEADGRFPNAEAKSVQDQGRRYFAGLFAKAPGGSYAWTARQSYIAMGFLLAAAAEKGIDSTPIEGLDTAKLDEILGLREKGMRSVAVVTLGYRSPNDGNAQRPKSRLALDRIVTRL